MKLLSTLNHGLDRSVAGKGNYGGELRLLFTTLNPADSSSTPPPFHWTVGSGAATDTYHLPSGDSISLNLLLSTETPGQLFILGAIQVTTTNGIVYGPQIGQAPPKNFLPKHPVLAAFQGRTQTLQGSLQFDIGFDVVVPWDGVSADCHGTWWATWQ